MKKNAMLKIAAILLVAVLLTTCAISTTFAKYVTNGTETPAGGARVAKWGLKFEAYAAEDKEPIFLNEYENGGFTLAKSSTQIVAPGTSNEGVVDVKITGTPEVSFALKATVTVALDNWTVKDAGDADVFYCPLTFDIGDATGISLDGLEETAAEEAIANAIANALTGANNADNGIATMKYEVGTDEFADFADIAADVSWSWADTVDAVKDDYDTQLGNIAHDNEGNAATIAISYTLSAEQIFA